MKKIIERLCPLPPPEKRTLLPSLYYRGELKNNIEPTRDADYLFYQVGSILEKIAFILLALCLLDVWLKTGFLIDLELIQKNKISFVWQWGNIMGPCSAFIAYLAYLRIRLTIDLKNEPVPIFFSKEAFQKELSRHGRRALVSTSGIFSVLFLVVVPIVAMTFGNQSMPDPDDMYYGLHFNNTLWQVIALQVLYLYTVPLFIMCGLSAALMFEKSFRFFLQMEKDMQQL